MEAAVAIAAAAMVTLAPASAIATEATTPPSSGYSVARAQGETEVDASVQRADEALQKRYDREDGSTGLRVRLATAAAGVLAARGATAVERSRRTACAAA